MRHGADVVIVSRKQERLNQSARELMGKFRTLSHYNFSSCCSWKKMCRCRGGCAKRSGSRKCPSQSLCWILFIVFMCRRFLNSAALILLWMEQQETSCVQLQDCRTMLSGMAIAQIVLGWQILALCLKLIQWVHTMSARQHLKPICVTMEALLLTSLRHCIMLDIRCRYLMIATVWNSYIWGSCWCCQSWCRCAHQALCCRMGPSRYSS